MLTLLLVKSVVLFLIARLLFGLPAVRMFRALGMPVTSWTIKSVADASAALKHADQIVFEGYLPASA